MMNDGQMVWLQVGHFQLIKRVISTLWPKKLGAFCTNQQRTLTPSFIMYRSSKLLRCRTTRLHIHRNIQHPPLKCDYCWLRFGCWPACCWSSCLWSSTPSFLGDLAGSDLILISSTVMKHRRIVIHQRNLEKWRQEQLKEKKNESTTEVSSGKEISK